MNPDFSFILPTRERPRLVQRLFQSLIETTSDPEALEIVLYVDDDDMESARIEHPTLRLLKLIGPRKSMGEMTQACYSSSHGRFVVLINDDMVIRTKNWDVAVKDAFARFPDEIAMAYADDLYYGKKVSTFPILPRKACDAMGKIVPAEYRSHCIDSHLFDIFERLEKLGFERSIYLPNVIFEHLHHGLGFEAGDGKPEKTDFDDRARYLSLADERQRVAAKLAEHIKRRSSAPEVTVITEDSAQAINAAASFAKGEYLAFLDPKARPQAGWLQALLQAAQDENAAIVAPKWINPRNGRIEHAGIGFYHDEAGALRMSRIYRGFKATAPAVNRKRPFQALARAGMLVKKDFFFRVGGLSSEFPGLEHVDLCLKARQLGLPVLYAPEAVLNYEGEADLPPRAVEAALLSRWWDTIEPDLPRLMAEDGIVLTPHPNSLPQAGEGGVRVEASRA